MTAKRSQRPLISFFCCKCPPFDGHLTAKVAAPASGRRKATCMHTACNETPPKLHHIPLAETETHGHTLLQRRLGNVVFMLSNLRSTHKKLFYPRRKEDWLQRDHCSASSGSHGNPSYRPRLRAVGVHRPPWQEGRRQGVAVLQARTSRTSTT